MRKPAFAQHHLGDVRNHQRDFLSLRKEIEMGTHICYPNVNFGVRHVVTVIRLNAWGIRHSREMAHMERERKPNIIPGSSNLLIWAKVIGKRREMFLRA